MVPQLQALQKQTLGGGNDANSPPPQAASPVSQSRSPQPQYQQHPYAMAGPAALAYTQQQYSIGGIQGTQADTNTYGRDRSGSRTGGSNFGNGAYNGRF
jgi:hypothetical protein